MPATTVATDQPLVPELQDRDRQFSAAKDTARALTEGLTDAQFNWRPEPGRWSIAECLDHLTATGSKLLPGMDAAIERARARGKAASGPFSYGWFDNWFIRGTGPMPATSKGMKHPKQYAPKADQPVERALPAFLELQDQLIQRLHAANGLDLARIKISSPILRLLRISLGAWFAATAGHQERHLEQARRVREHPGFPRS
jgi:hypothetical protein